jgi:hypothetical protein
MVAEILTYFRDMTQVVIGEAIMPKDITNFLDQHGIPWAQAEQPHQLGLAIPLRFIADRLCRALCLVGSDRKIAK